jgi:hypothetical protein
MTDIAKKLFGAMLVDGNVATLYTAPANTVGIIKSISVLNVTEVPGLLTTVKIWQDGNADANVILPKTNLAPQERAHFNGMISVDAGGTIKAQAGAGNIITITGWGVEIA